MPCPKEKVLNPITNRCILIDGSTARKLGLKRSPLKSKIEKKIIKKSKSHPNEMTEGIVVFSSGFGRNYYHDVIIDKRTGSNNRILHIHLVDKNASPLKDGKGKEITKFAYNKYNVLVPYGNDPSSKRLYHLFIEPNEIASYQREKKITSKEMH